MDAAPAHALGSPQLCLSIVEAIFYPPANKAKKNPRQFPAGGSFRDLSDEPDYQLRWARRSKLKACWSLSSYDARWRLGGKHQCRRWRNHARVLLIEALVQEIGRERQVLDRGPAGNRTHLPDIEVRVAGSTCRYEPDDVAADKSRGRTVVLHSSIRTVERGAPEGIPVVVEATAETPRGSQLKLGRIGRRICNAGKNSVGRCCKSEALVNARQTGATEHHVVVCGQAPASCNGSHRWYTRPAC